MVRVSAATVLAHGVGGRSDLPLPASVAAVGAAAVLVATAALLAGLWREPRLDPERGRALPGLTRAVDARPARLALRALGVAALGYVAVPAVLGPSTSANPVPYVVYVALWVGVVPVSLLLGPVVRLVSPVRALATAARALLRRDPAGSRPLPPGLGWWPAAAGALAFTWCELVAPDRSEPRFVAAAGGVYLLVQVGAGVVYGQRWFARGELFEAYGDLVGRLAPVGRRASDRRLVLRNPLDGLATLRDEPGLVALVTVLLGSTAYDSASGLPSWVDLTQGSTVTAVLGGTLGLLGSVLAVAGAYRLGAPVSPPAGGGPPPARVPGLFAHSLVPLVVGYVVAHYFSLLVFEGWRTVLLLDDPLGRGASVLGLAGARVDYGLLSPDLIAWVQVAAVVVGHVVGVVAAHDRAVALFPRAVATRAQMPLLVLIVLVTGGGIALLFAA